MKNPKYKVNEKAKVNNWTGLTNELEILDIKKIYHRRLQQYYWGIK